MVFSATIPMIDGSHYVVKRLLAKASSNTKTAKSDKAELGYLTYSLSLAPASISGFNLCASSSHGCRTACLFTAGFANIFPRTIQPGRIARARFFKLFKEQFRNRLFKELKDASRLATRKGLKLCVRLNVVSDVQWEREFATLFTQFPQITFYDYTKHQARMMKFLEGGLPSNYHLTFSWSEKNRDQCIDILSKGGNVAVPFQIKYVGEKRRPLPKSFCGFKIIDGDITDLRFLDRKAKKGKAGFIVGLRAKGKAKKDETGFVVNSTDDGVIL